jgi:ribonucleotide reductase beta subunit family protein with ferritin-like domain
MNTNPKSRKDLVCKKLGDEAMLYDPSNENVHVLNTTSLFIWNLLDGNHAIADIETKMRQNFTIPSEVNLSNDITKTITDFKGKGLLE